MGLGSVERGTEERGRAVEPTLDRGQARRAAKCLAGLALDVVDVSASLQCGAGPCKAHSAVRWENHSRRGTA